MYNYIMENNKITKEYIDKMGYVVEEVIPDVFLVNNFITQYEIESILSEAEAATQEDWSSHYNNSLIEFAEKKFGRTDIKNLIDEGKVQITVGWSDKNIALKNNDNVIRDINKRIKDFYHGFSDVEPTGIRTLQRQYENSPLPAHVDDYTDPSLVYATIIYINDDYTDGEFYFVRQGIELKPPAGSMMIFPTGEDFEHGVKSPGAGPTRYVLPCFVSYKDFYKKPSNS